MNDITIFTQVYVNVHRFPSGIVTAQSHQTLDQAEAQAKQVNKGKRGGKVVARIRVPLVCVEGQYDV